MSLEVDIKKSWSDFKLDVRFKAGREILGFLGASGSGKSMTLKCIAGIVRPDEGVIILDGVPLFDSDKKLNVPPQQRKTGYMFQNAALFPNMTARQNIQCVVRNKPNRDQLLKKIEEFFEIMGLSGLGDRYPSQLSGGQQQRVALVRILMSSPSVLMLDEPFSALDSYLRWQLEQELGLILNDFGGTSLFVSHNRDEVYRLCHRVAVISSGSVVADGDKWELFQNPVSYDACLLTGCKNISSVHPVSADSVRADDWNLELDCGGKATGDIRYVGIRAHDIVLTGTPGLSNTFEVEAVSTLRDTFSYILLLREKDSAAPKTLRLEMSREAYANLGTLPKYVRLPPEKLLLLTK
jgi:molybdate transport system ATP-binding protein